MGRISVSLNGTYFSGDYFAVEDYLTFKFGKGNANEILTGLQKNRNGVFKRGTMTVRKINNQSKRSYYK